MTSKPVKKQWSSLNQACRCDKQPSSSVSISPPYSTGNPYRLDRQKLIEDVQKYPDDYQRERAARLGYSQNAVFHVLKTLGLTRKKSLKHPKACPELRKKFTYLVDNLLNGKREIICLDEPSFCSGPLRTQGYAIKGTRCYGSFDWHQKHQTNAIGALIEGRLKAVCLFDRTVNGDIFETWVKGFLLHALPPHSVVVMDNAAFHKRETTKILIEDAGHDIVWPQPYGSDLNPIEKTWAWVKAKWREFRNKTVDELFKWCMDFQWV